MKYAIIDTSGVPRIHGGEKHFPVTNVIEWVGDQYAPLGLMVATQAANVGQLYNVATGAFTDDPEPATEPTE